MSKDMKSLKGISSLEDKKIDLNNVVGGIAANPSEGFYEIRSNFVDDHGCYDVDVYQGNGGPYLSRVWIRDGYMPHF